MTLTRIWILSPNYSSRSGSTVRLIVLHTAEGSRTYQSLGNYFSSPSSGVSSHVGIDDTPNVVGEYVTRPNKAWTASNANPIAVQAEMCAFAAWSPAEWSAHPQMLSNLARWIAEEAAHFNIPIVKLSPQAAQSNGRGVCQHRDLGSWGGNHSDCGDGFPIDQVLAMAGGVSPVPPPSPTDEEIHMFTAVATSDSTNGKIKKNWQYTVTDTRIVSVNAPADSDALRKKLGELVSLTGDQLAAFAG